MADRSERRWDLDAIRGLMLVLMAITHWPTLFSDPLGQPFGYVSAAEGFVMLSAFMAGMVYSARARRDGDEAMQEAFFKRALKIYFCQVALLAFAFTFIAVIGSIGQQESVTNLLGFYFNRPWTAFLSGLLLIYNPALLDILPIYILFMLASPLLLLHGMHRGWNVILTGSVALWLLAQFDLGLGIYGLIGIVIPLPVSYQNTGAFEIFAWQFLWVLGLWMGSTQGEEGAAPVVFPRWLVRAAVAIGITGFVWRHVVGQVPFPAVELRHLEPLFDKWHIGPLRLINFFALLVLVMHFGPWLKERLPRLPVLETLGQASLPVFCAHLVIALTALAFFGPPHPERLWAIDVAVTAGGFAALYAVARISQALDQRTAAMRARVKARAARGFKGTSATGGSRSPASTAHSPPR